jgi:inner membrane protein
VLLTSALCRQKLPWFKAWLVCCVGLLSHLLLDWTNSYGVRPLIPFSSRWFYLDLNALYDWTIWIVLAGCLLWPLFSRLVGGEIGERRRRTGRGSAIFALSFFLLFDIGRAVLHGRAVAQLEARLYEGAAPVSVAALPRTFDPFHWRGIVETEGTYRLLTVNTLGSFDPEDGPVFFKPAVTPAMLKILATPAFHYMRYFARFPAWTEEPAFLDTGKGTRFDLTDLRFGFHCVGVVDSKGEVLQSEFSFGTPH